MEWHIVNVIVVKIAIRHLRVTPTSLNNDEQILICFPIKPTVCQLFQFPEEKLERHALIPRR